MDIANVAVGLRAQARGVAGDLAIGQSALYRAINLKSQNVEQAIVHTAKLNALQAIDRAHKTAGGLNVHGLAIDPALVTAATKAIDAYAQAADQAASFVEDDAFNATMFMTHAGAEYVAAEQDAGALRRPRRKCPV